MVKRPRFGSTLFGGNTGSTPAPPDVTAPILSNPTDISTGQTTGDGTVDTDEGNGVLYWVLTPSITSPSAAQVKAGLDDLGAPALFSDSQVVIAIGTQNIAFSGLTAATMYFAHYMQEDAALNQSNVSSADGFTTDASGYVFVNPEAEAVVNAFSVEPDDTDKELIDDFVGALIAADIWDDLDVLWVLAAHDSQAAHINWKAPASFTLIPVNSPTFVTDRGYSGDGATSRLRTQFTPSINAVNYTQNDASAWEWCLTNVDAAVGDFGNVGPPSVFIIPRTSTNSAHRINEGTSTNVAGAVTSIGFFGSQRLAGGTKKFWRDGVQASSVSVASTGIPTQELWICGRFNIVFSTRQIALVALGASLDTKEAAFHAAALAYMQGKGAA